jgi:hypothetical protein
MQKHLRSLQNASQITPKKHCNQEWILKETGNLWGGEYPQKEWIDKYTKDNPVVVHRLMDT